MRKDGAWQLAHVVLPTPSHTAAYKGHLVKVVKIFIGVAIILGLVLLAVIFKAQRSLLYHPSHFYVPLTEAHANRAFHEVAVGTQDGIALKAWYAPATTGPFTIVFFHGNADSLYTASHNADPFISAGYGFLVSEYRGYSGLPGTPTENGLYADGRASLRYLIAQGVRENRIIVFGHSLGTGVAIEMANEFHVAGVMLAAPYLSMPKLARVHFPFFPSFLVLDRFENEQKVKNMHAPLLIVNGFDDNIIPPEQGRKLFSLANEPREFHSLPDRGHNDLFNDFVPLSLDWMSRISIQKPGS